MNYFILAEMSSSSNENINLQNEKIEIKNAGAGNIDKKHPARFSIYPQSLRNIFIPDNPTFLQRTLKPSFVLGVLLGFSISYYYFAHEIFYFLEKKKALMNSEIATLKNEIRVLSNKKE